MEKNTATDRLLDMTARTLRTSRLILWKHKNIRVQLDEEDEVSCWVAICRKPYQDRIANNVRDKEKEFWNLNSHVLPNENDVV